LTVVESGSLADMTIARTGIRAAVTAVVAALVLFSFAPVAQAQAPSPYGSTTTTMPGGSADTACTLNLTRARPGELVTARVFPVAPGAIVRILFDGVQVGIGQAPGGPVVANATGAPVQFNGVALLAQTAVTTSVTIEFRVPDVTVGDHSITAVGSNFTCFCNPDGVFTVLAKTASNSLARTGVYLALFLVAALFCFVLGRAFLRASHIARARAEAAAREAERPRSLIDL
jgi:hypothetical protein